MTTNEAGKNTFNTEEVFPGFSWQEGTKPELLHLNRAGFFESDDGTWHLVRRAQATAPAAEVKPSDLYSGSKVSYHNATQGSGLYFTNTVEAATNVVYTARAAKQPRTLYIASIAPDEDHVLDATNSVKDRRLRERMGAQMLQAMAVIPGMIYPTPRMYDYMYDRNSLIVSKPSAVQRYRPGMRAVIGSEVVKPRFAVVRDLSAVAINAHRLP